MCTLPTALQISYYIACALTFLVLHLTMFVLTLMYQLTFLFVQLTPPTPFPILNEFDIFFSCFLTTPHPVEVMISRVHCNRPEMHPVPTKLIQCSPKAVTWDPLAGFATGLNISVAVAHFTHITLVDFVFGCIAAH